MIKISLSFNKPPITANHRHHWAKKAKITKAIRHEAFIRAKAARLPRVKHAQIRLFYQPADNRRRDPSNLMPTQKALVDGLVDAGLVPDDTPEFITEHMPKILPTAGRGNAAMWLEIDLTNC